MSKVADNKTPELPPVAKLEQRSKKKKTPKEEKGTKKPKAGKEGQYAFDCDKTVLYKVNGFSIRMPKCTPRPVAPKQATPATPKKN